MEETEASFLITLREQTLSGNLSGGIHEMHISLVKSHEKFKAASGRSHDQSF
jgi:hypothetical protein